MWLRIQNNDNANPLCNDGTGGQRSKGRGGGGGFRNTEISNFSMTMQTHYAMMEPVGGDPKTMRVKEDSETLIY